MRSKREGKNNFKEFLCAKALSGGFWIVLFIFFSQLSLSAKEAKLTFHWESCSHKQEQSNFNSKNSPDSEISLIQWKSKDELQISGSVRESCGIEIINAEYYLDGETLILSYSVEGTPANCICNYPVFYSIKGLPKKDYEVILKCDRRNFYK
ncbi:MAG: hypothetical protein WC546_04160 [Candidatus Omnitrophota bacterium]